MLVDNVIQICNLNKKWKSDTCYCECKKPKNIVYAKKFILEILAYVLGSAVKSVDYMNI